MIHKCSEGGGTGTYTHLICWNAWLTVWNNITVGRVCVFSTILYQYVVHLYLCCRFQPPAICISACSCTVGEKRKKKKKKKKRKEANCWCLLCISPRHAAIEIFNNYHKYGYILYVHTYLRGLYPPEWKPNTLSTAGREGYLYTLHTHLYTLPTERSSVSRRGSETDLYGGKTFYLSLIGRS